MAEKLILGITMGDPAGIGPEITVKALAKKDVYKRQASITRRHFSPPATVSIPGADSMSSS